MADSEMNTNGFAPGDHELWEQIEGAGELSEQIMRSIGTFGIGSQTVLREIIFAIAEFERNAGVESGNPDYPQSRD